MLKYSILILVFIIFLLIIGGICYFLYKEHFTETKFDILKKYIVPKEIRNKILEGYKVLHNIFEKNNIFYIIEGGTLLGAVRNEKLIPWDDDGDVFVWKKDQKKIMTLVDEFSKYGYLLSETIHPRVLRVILDKEKNYPFIDLFLYDDPDVDDNNNKVIRCLPKNVEDLPNGITCNKNQCCYPDRSVTWWWQNSYSVDDIHPRKLYKVNDIELWGPSNPIPYIEGWYGKDALNTYKFTHDHNGENKKEYTFTPEEIEDIYAKLY
jgi:phosphorylcholine metabolism protein LicD